MKFDFLDSYLSRRRTERELSKLTDRELNDIGITRGDIVAVSRGRHV